MSAMSCFAQTNIQLYNQLLGQGVDEQGLRLVRSGYELAMRIFAGQYRPCGKPFLAHLVGTASILTAHGEPAAVVTAGLLHSAFSHGDFGDVIGELNHCKRVRLEQAVGQPVTGLIELYHQTTWTADAVRRMCRDLPRLGHEQRQVLSIKLADTCEEYFDYGLNYSPGKSLHLESCQDVDDWKALFAEAATALGNEALAEEFLRLWRASEQFAPPAVLMGDQNVSFQLAPLSHALRPAVRLRRAQARLVKKLARRWRRRRRQAG